MTRFSLSPLFRHTVGFEHLDQLFNTLNQVDDTAKAYPPYNIAKTDDNHYRIELSVAGFCVDELEVKEEANQLVVTASPQKKEQASEPEYLHRGISRRGFVRKFDLADHVHIVDVKLTQGLLSVALKREIPESAKPRIINIDQ